MNRILLLFLSCCILVSCELYTPTRSNRTADNLQWLTKSLADVAAISPANAMEGCMRAQNFLMADEEERKSAIYSSFGYYPSDKCVKIDNWGTVYTSGVDLYSDSAVWSVTTGNSDYTVKYIGESQWEISNQTNYEYDYVSKNTTYSAIFTLVSKDIDGFCTWSCTSEGFYQEDNTYSASLSIPGLVFKRNASSSSDGTIKSSLVYSGEMASTVFKNGEKTDWCSMTYENSEVKKVSTSLD